MHFDIDTCLSIGSQDLVANLFLKYIYEPFFNFSCNNNNNNQSSQFLVTSMILDDITETKV